MENKELFDKTVAILVKAYQNDTLEYCSCTSCAVGNMVAANNGIKLINNGGLIESEGFRNNSSWGNAITSFGTGVIHDISQINEMAIEQIQSTGYSIQEIANIEKAFYIGVSTRFGGRDENFSGLMSVIDCLMEIHEATTEEATEAKELFVKA